MSDKIELDAAEKSSRTGLLQGIFCYLIWGAMPVYWKLLSGVPAIEVLAWRMVWSCVFVVVLCVVVKRVRFLYLMGDKRALRTFLLSGIIISFNWGIYVWSANNGYLLETSIGYYLCPLASIFCGVVFFKERLTPAQKFATASAAAGVVFFIVVHGGMIWISFGLALTFSVYGAVKKRGGYPALPGMALESLLTGMIGIVMIGAGLVFPALWQLTPAFPDPSAVTDSTTVVVLMIGSGILTAIPLLLFSSAANRISLVAIGFLQYIAPTMGLLLAVFLYGEAFTFAHGVCFALIWIGIAAVSIEPFVRKARRTRNHAHL